MLLKEPPPTPQPHSHFLLQCRRVLGSESGHVFRSAGLYSRWPPDKEAVQSLMCSSVTVGAACRCSALLWRTFASAEMLQAITWALMF